MIIKKFQAKNEEEAKLLAQNELGSGVVIMNVKTIKKKGLLSLFKPPVVEITAAVEEESDNPPPKPKAPVKEKPKFVDVIMDDDSAQSSLGNGQVGSISARPSERGDIEAKLESLHSLIEERLVKEDKTESAPTMSDISSKNEKPSEMVQFLKLIYNTLMDNEVDEKYANELLGEMDQIKRTGISIDNVLSSLYQKMVLKLGEAKTITPATNGPKVVFFVGPTGVGKTTTIAKVASILTVSQKKKVALLTTDTYRIAAAEQLKTYANILNNPFEIVYTAQELSSAVDEYRDYDFILVDTAGHSPKNEELKEGTKQFIAALPDEIEKEVYLVLSATTKYRDLLGIADMYREMTDFKLIFTKLDETECLGNIWNLRLYTGQPLSYITCGQNVPDDICSFNPQATVKKLLGGSKDEQ